MMKIEKGPMPVNDAVVKYMVLRDDNSNTCYDMRSVVRDVPQKVIELGLLLFVFS